MKVLLVSPFSAQRAGGIGTWTKSVLDFAPNDPDTALFFLNTGFGLKRQIKGRFKTLKRLTIGSLDSSRVLIRLFFAMMIKRPDVVHYTSSAAFALWKDKIAIFIVRKIFGKHFVIHWHFGRIPEMSKNGTKEYQLFKTVHVMADASIVLDRFSAEAMCRDGLENVYVVPNAVTQAVYDYSLSLNMATVQKNRSHNKVLFVGHILKTKGIEELVQSCVQIDGVELIVVGPDLGQLQPSLKATASQRDGGKWLTFTGELKREQVLEYYKSCTLFCLPSYSEGFPYVILESMSCGCPIVATDVGAIPDMLDGGCGSIVNPKDVDQLKGALTAVLSNHSLRFSMGNIAYQKVMKEYTIESIYSNYKTIWQKVYDFNRQCI